MINRQLAAYTTLNNWGFVCLLLANIGNIGNIIFGWNVPCGVLTGLSLIAFGVAHFALRGALKD